MSLLAFSLFLNGCRAEAPPEKKLDLASGKDLIATPDFPAGCPAQPTLEPPRIDSFPNPTSYALQPFRGTTPGADLIMARGGAGAAKPVKVGSDGRFCIEVTLLPDSPNSITFTPVDRNGCPGRETLITLWHKSTGKADAGVSSVINVAKNAPVSSDVEPGGGTLLQHVNDGDPLSWVELSFTDIEAGSSCNRFTWIRLDLTKVYIISKIKVRWAQDGGSDYGVCYTVLYSSATSPTNPDPIPGDWKVAKEESNGDDTDQLLSLSPVSARWVALLLYENASFGIQETFKVGELEVWGQDPNVTPPPPPDGCY